MKSARRFSKWFFLLLCSFFVMTLCSNSAQGAEEKIVPEMKISGHKVVSLNYTFGASPSTVRAKRGTTVIWMNDSRSSAIISFTGKPVTLACKSPVHFVVDEQGSFTSNEIPPGAVASLCFVEKGTFDYKIIQQTPQTAPTQSPREFKGTIIIEE